MNGERQKEWMIGINGTGCIGDDGKGSRAGFLVDEITYFFEIHAVLMDFLVD